MPRPGPRPYECVRRAWHSDRHQPMRGTLIQEIFRIANEVHSPATRKNKEWQEKLPVVVLKAEEIMYSKANSEAEYMDPKTLWERANDAIDIIIRRDDTPETGDLLQPCIEAALNLGCIARRASRSQRHNNPEFYLSTSRKETTATSPNIPDSIKAHPGSSTCMLPSPSPHPSNSLSPSSQPASWYPTYMKSTPIKPGCPQIIGSFSRNPSHEQAPVPLSNHDFPILCKDALLSAQEESLSVPVRTFKWPLMGRAYPLCYIDNNPLVVSQPSIPNPQAPLRNPATVTASHLPPPTGGTSTRFRQNFIDCTTTMNKSSYFGEPSEKRSNIVYDLSLRLGLPSPPPHEDLGVEDVESSIDGDNTEEPSESCSSKESSEGEVVFYHEASGGKRRVPIGPSTKDGYISWKQNTSRDQLFNR